MNSDDPNKDDPMKVAMSDKPENSKPDSIIHKEKIESQFSAWNGDHKKLKEYIVDHLNDPGSYENVKTVYWDRDSLIVVKTEYTAKNGFGGRVRGTVMAQCDLDGNVIKIMSSE